MPADSHNAALSLLEDLIGKAKAAGADAADAVLFDGASLSLSQRLGQPEQLHPMQAAFVKHDGYQCGYCTPGQICSAVAVLDEIKAGIPSHVSPDLTAPPELTNAELRERMSGNICRCGAYSNIAEAIAEVAESST